MELFELQKVVLSFATPLGLAILLALLGLALSRRGLVLGAIVWLWLWSTPWAATRLAEWIEAPNPLVNAAPLPAADVILVLGGALSPGVANWHPDINLGEAADRLFKAADLYRQGKAPMVLFSGGPTNYVGDSEAKSAAEIMVQLGVPAAAIAIEPQSRTTRENVAFSLPILKSLGAHRVLLVSSAWHLPRATLNFRAGAAQAGLDLEFVPVPCDPIEIVDNIHTLRRWLPNAQALEVSRMMFKELFGTAYARLLPER